jgi:hypothetical protein
LKSEEKQGEEEEEEGGKYKTKICIYFNILIF